ncbi:MAG: helix-turn-helix transcriptional regulator [Oscillospiraceae bacterium]|nr:helix-turn-helix transcriptional regulator [Oscillospiraceae bacterium]
MEFEQTTATEQTSYALSSLFPPEKVEVILCNLRELYKRSGLNTTYVSKASGLSESTVVRYVTGKSKNPHIFPMVSIILVMGGDIYEILGIPSPSSFAVPVPTENPYGDLIEASRAAAQDTIASNEKLSSTVELLSKQLGRSNKTIIILCVILCIFLLIFSALEIVDLCNPDWGRYQWAAELFEQFLQKV